MLLFVSLKVLGSRSFHLSSWGYWVVATMLSFKCYIFSFFAFFFLLFFKKQYWGNKTTMALSMQTWAPPTKLHFQSLILLSIFT